ncbi:MAG: SRPBCC family protein [Pseudoclavibacter sp.]
MTRVSESIDVDVPAEKVFWAVTDPDTMPRFLSLVKEMEVTGPDTTKWVVEIAGKTASFSAKATEVDPPNHARYESQSQRVPFVLDLRCETKSPTTTGLTIEAEFNAGGMAEKLGLAKGIAQVALKNQLANAKKYLERRFAGETA